MKVQVIRSNKQPLRYDVSIAMPLAAALGIKGARKFTGNC